MSKAMQKSTGIYSKNWVSSEIPIEIERRTRKESVELYDRFRVSEEAYYLILDDDRVSLGTER